MSSRTLDLAVWAVLLALAMLLGAPGLRGHGCAAGAAAAPLAAPDDSVQLQPFVTSGLAGPVFVTHAGDGSGRLFVVERAGRIKVIANGQLLPTPFLDLTSAVVSAGGEQGLLGLAFHPNYENNGRFFVFYTAQPSTPANVGSNTLAEFRVSGNPNVANPAPERTLFALPDRQTNHNGGMLAFGPDGYLYVGTGDEGGGGDPYENAQNLGALFGKLLRLDVNGPPAPGLAYAIPPDNPFVGTPGARPEIWAYGFRNPWRWSIDRMTGDIYVGDVGQGAWEEVDRLPRGQGGLNFGWDDREGAHCYEPPSGCETAGRIDPILEYSRASNGSGCASITGGYVYRGTAQPALQGVYVYADFCSGRIWKGIAPNGPGGAWSAVEARDTDLSISSFGEDEVGELYVVDLGGAIYRLVQAVPPCTPRPRVAVQVSQAGPGTLAVTISAGTTAQLPSNELQSLAFSRTENARVTVGGQTGQQGSFTVPLAPGTRETRFTVQREQAGRPMHVDLTVTDRCGPWPTFVGAGVAVP